MYIYIMQSIFWMRPLFDIGYNTLGRYPREVIKRAMFSFLVCGPLSQPHNIGIYKRHCELKFRNDMFESL